MNELTARTLLDKVLSTRTSPGNARVRAIIDSITGDLFRTIEDFDVQPKEFWAAADWLGALGASGQVGLVTAGLGFDRLLDIRADAADAKAGRATATPRAIEGPLYVPGAPVSEGMARLDDEGDPGAPLVVEGLARDERGRALAGATVDVWHANHHGRYSGFDPDQREFHLRRRIVTDAQGRYRFRTALPPGYAIPPTGPTAELFGALGRHGNRPAHIHYLVSAAGMRTLTTQVNLPGDPFLDDDFAFATRDELVIELSTRNGQGDDTSLGIVGTYQHSRFDLVLQSTSEAAEQQHLGRAALAASSPTNS